MIKVGTRNTLLLHFIVLVWGATGIVGNEVSLRATQIVWWRVLFAVAALLFWALAGRKSLRVTRSQLKHLALSGVLIGLHWFCFFEAIKRLNISLPLAIMGSTAFFVALLTPLFTTQKILFRDVAVSALAFLGLSVVLGVEAPHIADAAIAVAAAILSAVFAILNGRLAAKHEPLLIGFWELIFAGITMWFFVALDSGVTESFAVPSTKDLILLVFLGVVCTAFAFVSSIRVMKVLSPYTCCLAIAMEPVYTISFAAFWYGEKEKLSPGFYFGVCLILLSLFLDAKLKRAPIGSAVNQG
jgi:drug/metabolite transporter (DMT)-like permease